VVEVGQGARHCELMPGESTSGYAETLHITSGVSEVSTAK